MSDLTATFGPPWRDDPAWQVFRWAILHVGYARGDVDVDPEAARPVQDWRWRPADEVARVAGSPWVEVWTPACGLVGARP